MSADLPARADPLALVGCGGGGGIRFALRRRVVFRAPVDQEGAAE